MNSSCDWPVFLPLHLPCCCCMLLLCMLETVVESGADQPMAAAHERFSYGISAMLCWLSRLTKRDIGSKIDCRSWNSETDKTVKRVKKQVKNRQQVRTDDSCDVVQVLLCPALTLRRLLWNWRESTCNASAGTCKCHSWKDIAVADGMKQALQYITIWQYWFIVSDYGLTCYIATCNIYVMWCDLRLSMNWGGTAQIDRKPEADFPIALSVCGLSPGVFHAKFREHGLT